MYQRVHLETHTLRSKCTVWRRCEDVLSKLSDLTDHVLDLAFGSAYSERGKAKARLKLSSLASAKSGVS